MARTKKAAGLKIKLVKSVIGCKKDQIATVYALGLKKIGDEVIQPDNDQTKGKIKAFKYKKLLNSLNQKSPFFNIIKFILYNFSFSCVDFYFHVCYNEV